MFFVLVMSLKSAYFELISCLCLRFVTVLKHTALVVDKTLVDSSVKFHLCINLTKTSNLLISQCYVKSVFWDIVRY
jgi:hypothetical protein